MAKSKVMWITRDALGNGVEIWAYRAHPSCRDGTFVSSFRGQWFCYPVFKRLTGITVKPGQRIKARLIKE